MRRFDVPGVGEADFRRAESHGLGRRAICDIGGVAACFNVSNRLAHLADMRPNEEFYAMRGESD